MESDTSSQISAEVKYDDDSDDSLEESTDDYGDEAEPQPEGGMKWADFYRQLKDRDATTRAHSVSTFFRYLMHVEGGCHSEEQALIQTRQVNIILDIIDPQGDDLSCLVRNDGLDFWNKFAGPKLTNKELTGNTLKVYIRSIELFITFIHKNLFYQKGLLTEDDREAIIRLNTRLPDYRATIHRRTANQTTTRKVNDSITEINAEDVRQLEGSQLAKTAIKLLGEAINHRLLTKNESTCVRDYLLVTAMYENGSRPGPLEYAKNARFEQAEFTESKKRWTLNVDEHKTTRHQGSAEIVMDERLYAYIKLYVRHLRPCFIASGVDYVFIKADGTASGKESLADALERCLQGQACNLT